MDAMAAMRRRMLWVHYLIVALGVWLATSPFQLGLLDAQGLTTVRDVTAERGLWPVPLRAALTGWNDLACGLALILLGGLSLNPRFKWAQWGTCFVGSGAKRCTPLRNEYEIHAHNRSFARIC